MGTSRKKEKAVSDQEKFYSDQEKADLHQNQMIFKPIFYTRDILLGFQTQLRHFAFEEEKILLLEKRRKFFVA